MGLTSVEVAKRLSVDPTTVTRTVQLFEETGTVCSIQGYRENTHKKLSLQDELVIFETVTSNPSIYLHEIQHTLLQATGKHVSISCIRKLLHKNRFLRKKLTYRAFQRSEELRSQYLSEISVYDPHTLVFVDETGTDKKNTLRGFRYALRGQQAISDRQLVKGKRHSTIAGMSMDGMLDIHITTQTVDADVFCEYIERYLLPYPLPFNSINPRSVVVMDNARIHHVDKVVPLIEEVGVHILRT